MSSLRQYPPLARFERSPMTQALIERLGGMHPGDFVSYGELSELSHCDVQDDQGRGFLGTAREALERERRMVFDVVVNQGLKRVDEAGTIAMSDARLSRIDRAAKRGVRQLGTVSNTEKLTMAQRVSLSANRARLGIVRLFASRRGEKLLTRAAQDPKMVDTKEVQKKALAIFR
jgi:hypothetical protein